MPAAAMATLLLSCGGGKPASLQIEPKTVQMSKKGESKTLTATVRDMDGGAISGAPVEWSSTNTKTVTVDAAGNVTAVASGVATVIAKSGDDVSGQSIVTVLIASRLVIEPDRVLLRSADETLDLTLKVLDEKGQLMPGGEVVWTSSDPAVVKVENGMLTAITDGRATVTATSAGLSASVDVTVRGPEPTTVRIDPSPVVLKSGASEQLVTAVTDDLGLAMENPKVAWSSLDSSVATVSESGLVTGVRRGDTSVTATAGKVTAEVEVKVR